MNSEYLTTRELAQLLRIKERKVYDLVASGAVPCSKATGKLLFPRSAIDAWLSEHRSGPLVQPQVPIPQVFLGSHDPLLDWALRESQCGIPTYFDGSLDGVNRFVAQQGLACGLHVINNSEPGWNTELVQQSCVSMPVVLIEWAKRQRGLIYRSDLRPVPVSLGDLAQHRIVARQAGAGAQSLFLNLMEKQSIDPQVVNWTVTVRTEDEAALSVLSGKADIAFGLQTLAQQYRLSFLPLLEERFDLLMSRHSWFEPPLQTFIRFCQSEAFVSHARELAGYDVSGFGCVHFNSPN